MQIDELTKLKSGYTCCNLCAIIKKARIWGGEGREDSCDHGLSRKVPEGKTCYELSGEEQAAIKQNRKKEQKKKCSSGVPFQIYSTSVFGSVGEKPSRKELQNTRRHPLT